jgi:hypothetical protein
MKLKDYFINEALSFLQRYRQPQDTRTPISDPVHKDTTKPSSRASQSEYQEDNTILGKIEGFTNPEFNPDIIPQLRYLAATNEDVGAVYNDLITLTNTGHKIVFDQSIAPEIQDEMRRHLKSKSVNWGSGVAGINGLINKWIGQIWVSGALSTEWVIANDMSGVENSVLVNPENIRFKYDNKTTKYKPYQIIRNKLLGIKLGNKVALNENTYSYVGMLNSTDSPYGIPPFLTALEALKTQKTMKKNINHILKQLGLLGYLEVKLTKPTQKAGESLPAYEARLDKLLADSKKNVLSGFHEGVVVGYEEDHEFEFHSTSQQLNGVSDIFNSNEIQVANGLKSQPTFIGQKSNGTESNLGIVFTKMLSQLRNVQEILASNLIRGYILELQLKGYNVTASSLSVVFNPSTITDDLKIQQGKEIKQRVAKLLLIDGIISNDQYAEEMGYNQPFSEKPLIPYKEQTGKAIDPEKKANDAANKTKSERKVRDKNKKQPRRNDTKTKN